MLILKASTVAAVETLATRFDGIIGCCAIAAQRVEQEFHLVYRT